MSENNKSQADSFTPPTVNEVSPQAILRWLSLGFQDMRQAGAPSLLHGIIVSIFSLVIVAMTLLYWQILPGAVSGFVLIGPFLATGLYALSQQLEKGRQPTLASVLSAWRHGSRCLFTFGMILVIAATAWVLFSVLMFHYFIEASISTPLDFLRYVLTQEDTNFILWTILGGLGSALAFAATVIAIPLLVERDVTTKIAIHTSIRAVGQNPITMVWWSMAILVLTGLSFITLMLGFIVLYPVLGHASWHVYRDLVNTSELPLRPGAE